jgi:SAM-dependent methyltransferase
MPMKFTGERFVPESPECSATIAYEHWHRYAYARQFATGKRVLDVACGEGYGAAFLAETAGAVVGVDIDPEAVTHARRAHFRENLEFLQGSAAAIPIEGEKSFDVITSFETIEHIDAASQLAFLGEVQRLLKDDGVFVVSSPDKRTYSDERSYRNEFHVKELYLDELRGLLEARFAHVAIVAQGVHGISYLHPLEARRGAMLEVSVRALSSGRFELEETPPPHLYFVAVCSAAPVEAPFSVLLDRAEGLLDERTVPWRAHVARVDESLFVARQELDTARAALASRERDLAERERELAEIKSSPVWRAKLAAERASSRLGELARKLGRRNEE